MPLTADRRAQLDQIVTKMDADGAPSTDIQAIVSDFTGKYGQEAKPGGVRGFVETAAENLVPEVIRHPSMLKDVPGAVSDIAQSDQPMLNAAGAPAKVLGATVRQFGSDVLGASQQASQEQADKGNTLGAIGAAVPLIGPAAAQAGEEIGQGETARGLGHAAGMLLPFAAGPAGRAAGKVVGPAGESAAAGAVNSLIKPLEKEFRFGRNPGAGIAEEGIVARNLPNLAEKTRGKMEAVGKVIGSKLSTPEANAKLIDIQPLTAPLDEAIAKATRVGDTETANRLQQFRDSPLFTEKQFVTPAEAHEIKGVVGDSTTWTGQGYDKTMNQAKASVYRNINDAIETAVPGVKAFQARYADLLSAVKSIERTTSVGQRAAPVNLMDAAMAGTALVAPGGGELAALAATGGRRLLTGPAGMTVMAQALRRAGLIPPLIGTATEASGLAARAQPKSTTQSGQ